MTAQPLSGRSALVTGASSGLGAATAFRLAQAGAVIWVLGRNEDGVATTVKSIREAGGAAEPLISDLSQPGNAQIAVEHVAAQPGGLDILVNNAAVFHTGTIAEQSFSMWSDMFQVNVLALIEASQAAIKALRESGREGHIVNISSLAARLDPGGVYGASKAAVDKVSEQLRAELESDPIRVVNIVPGAFSTNLGRNMTPEQIEGLMASFSRAEVTPDSDGRTALVGIPDDIARAVLHAVTYPINLNIFEMIVRPAKNTIV